jgi:hypothetical protein
MAGLFDTSIVINFVYILLGIVIVFALIGFIIREYTLNKRYCPERKIIIPARKLGVPVIELIDIGSNNTVWELGTKSNSSDIKFETKYSGIRIDPILTSVGAEPKRFGGGLDVYSYAYENWLPQTIRNHLAFKAISEYFHTKAKDLEFLTDIEFVALISTPEMHLQHDVNVYISKYFKNKTFKDNDGHEYTKMYRQYQKVDTDQYIEVLDKDETILVEDDSSPTGISKIQNPMFMKMKQIPNPTVGQLKWYEQEIDTPDLINRIESIKGDISRLPIAFGWFSGTEAFKNNAYAYTAQDLEMLLIIHDKQMLADMLKKINMMIYVIAALIVMIGGAISFYIINMVKH